MDIFTQIAPNLPTVDFWYSTLATLDLFLMALWAVVILVLSAGVVLSRLTAIRIHIPPISLSWLNHRYFWLILLTLAFLARLPKLLFVPYWYDETFTAVMARLPMQRFWVALAGDVHPPGYYLICKGFGSLLGYGEVSLRLPALIAGMVLIPVMYRLSLAIVQDRNVSKLCAVLVAFSPTSIHYSAEARYPMLLALAVAAGWLAIVENKPFLFMVAGAIMPQLHATGLIYAGVLVACYMVYFCAWLYWSYQLRSLGVASGMSGNLAKMFLACSVAAISCLMYLAMVVNQSSDVSNGFWLYKMIPVWHITLGTVMSPSIIPLMVTAYTAVIVLFLFSIPVLYRHDWLMLTVVLGVPIVMAIISQVWKPVYLPRALIGSSFLVFIGWSWLAVHSGAVFRWLILLALASGLIAHVFDMNREMPMDDLFARCDGADVVYTTSTNMAIISLYYAPENSITWSGGNNQHQTIPYRSRQAMGFDFTPPELVGSSMCVVSQLTYYSTEDESELVGQLEKRAHSIEMVNGSEFINFEIIWVDLWAK